MIKHHAFRRPRRLAALAVAAGAAALVGYSSGAPAAAAQTASPAPAAATHPQELRDVRYCEVIPSVQNGPTVTTYVYNTLGYNNCPRSKWNALTEEEVNAEFGSQKAELNGPRHFVIDYAQATSPASNGSKTFTFGGIQTGLRATLTTQAGQPTVGQQAYVPNQVARDTIFTFLAGQPVFELTAPDGHVYVMPSYSQIVDPRLAYRDLPRLGCALTLPAGWSYSTKTLTTTLELNSNGLTYVVNDNWATPTSGCRSPARRVSGWPLTRAFVPGIARSRSSAARRQPPALAEQDSPMTSPSARTSHLTGLRGARYGEILLITSQAGQLTAVVYNTTGLNDCPPATWRSLDPRGLAKDFGVPAVHLNGPRFWTLDQIAARAAGEVLSFGGLDARQVAELPIPPDLDLAGPAGRYYRDITIRRETKWIFAAGRPVYELLTPDAKTYVMQAYSHIVDDSLTGDSLPALGDSLHLPEGWRYRTRTPDRDLTLRTVAGAAHVLQDELQNTYMRLMTA